MFPFHCPVFPFQSRVPIPMPNVPVPIPSTAIPISMFPFHFPVLPFQSSVFPFHFPVFPFQPSPFLGGPSSISQPQGQGWARRCPGGEQGTPAGIRGAIPAPLDCLFIPPFAAGLGRAGLGAAVINYRAVRDRSRAGSARRQPRFVFAWGHLVATATTAECPEDGEQWVPAALASCIPALGFQHRCSPSPSPQGCPQMGFISGS